MAQTWLDSWVAHIGTRLKEAMKARKVRKSVVLDDMDAARRFCKHSLKTLTAQLVVEPCSVAEEHIVGMWTFLHAVAPFLQMRGDEANRLFNRPVSAIQPTVTLVRALEGGEPPNAGLPLIRAILDRGHLYVDLPHRSFVIGEALQVRAIITYPSECASTGSLNVTGCLVLTRIDSNRCVYRYMWNWGDERLPLEMPGEQDDDLLSDVETIDVRMLIRAAENLIGLLVLHRDIRQQNRADFLPHMRAAEMFGNPRRAAQRQKTHSLFRVMTLEAPSDNFGRPSGREPRRNACGDVGAGWHLDYRQPVRGHFKIQRHGPRNMMRRLIWVEGYERGPEDGRHRPDIIRLGVPKAR